MSQSNTENRLLNLINSITASQASEQDILNILQNDDNISSLDLEVYMNNLDDYSKEREESMNNLNSIISKLDSSDSDQYTKQVQLLLINEQRLTDLKAQSKLLSAKETNKQREVQVSNYYRKYYRAWSGYMALFVLVLFINIIMYYLVHKQYLPALVVAITIPISIMVLFLFSSDLRKRDNMIFDEYDWNFDPKNVKIDTSVGEPQPATQSESSSRCAADIAASITESGGTIQCEEGKIYDAALYKCVIKPSEDAKEGPIETFSNYGDYKTFQIE